MSKLNGFYRIVSVDTNSVTLDYVFTYRSTSNWKIVPEKIDYIQLSSLDERHIKASLFVKGKMVKSKTIKGKIKQNYFEFNTNHFSWKYVFIIYRKQTNRIALTATDELLLDTNSGGIGFLLFLPIPLSGSARDTYHLKYKRIQ